jgi:uracil-DNA glycosylase
MIVGDCPSREDINRGTCFSGASGWELDKMLQEAGIRKDSCFLTYACLEYPPSGTPDSLIPIKKKDIKPEHLPYGNRYIHPFLAEGIRVLKEEIARQRPNVIIALGDVALWSLCQVSSVDTWRGSELIDSWGLDTKVVPTYSPSTIFKNLANRPICIQDLKRAKRESGGKEVTHVDYKLVIRPDYPTATSALLGILSRLASGSTPIVCDLEIRNNHISCCGLAWSATEAICIPFMDGYKDYWPIDEETTIQNLIRQILTHPNAQVVGQNYMFDVQHLYRSFNFISSFSRDTMLAQHVCFPAFPKDLSFLASLYCEHYCQWKDDGKSLFSGSDEMKLWQYNAMDCCRTFEVDQAIQPVVDAMGLRAQHDFQMSLFAPVFRTIRRGIRVDEDRQQRLIKELREAQTKAKEELDYILGTSVNINSPAQIADLFYRDLGQSAYHNRKTGSVTTSDEALEKIATREPLLLPIVQRIQELRSIGVFLSTFLGQTKGKWDRGLLDIDSRMRCNFNIGGTKTYRFSSDKNAYGTGMNFQNLPKGDEESESHEIVITK